MRTPMLIVLFLGILALLVQGAEAGTYHQWTTEEGTLAFTDDPKRIPGKYKNVAEKRDLGKDSLGSYSRFTVAVARETLQDRLEYLRESSLVAGSNLNHMETCDGHTTVTRERHSYTSPRTSWTGSNAYNSTFYVVRDSCGNPQSVTLINPKAEIEN